MNTWDKWKYLWKELKKRTKEPIYNPSFVFFFIKKMALVAYEGKNISTKYFMDILMPAGEIDFSLDQFRNSSGSGRSTIRRAIEGKLGF